MIFYGLSASVGCWSSVFIRRIITHLNACPFDYTAFATSGKVRIPWTGLTTPVGGCRYFSWPIQVGPQSLCNRRSWIFFCGFRGFCHWTESDLFLFLLLVAFWAVTLRCGLLCWYQGFCRRTAWVRSLPFSLNITGNNKLAGQQNIINYTRMRNCHHRLIIMVIRFSGRSWIFNQFGIFR